MLTDQLLPPKRPEGLSDGAPRCSALRGLELRPGPSLGPGSVPPAEPSVHYNSGLRSDRGEDE
jgi:hypothetical protein